MPDRLIRAVRFAPGGGHLVLALGDTDRNVAREIAWYAAETDEITRRVPAPSWIMDVAPADAGQRVLTSTKGGLYVCDPEAGRVERLHDFGTDSAWELAMDRSGKRIAGAFLRGPALSVLDLDSGRTEALSPSEEGGLGGISPRTAISLSGSHVAVSLGFRATGHWCLDADATIIPLPSPESADVVSASADARLDAVVEALPMSGALARRVWLLGGENGVLVVAGMIPYRTFAPVMCLWTVPRGRPDEARLLNLDSTFAGVDLTSDGRLCIASDGQIRNRLAVWDTHRAIKLLDFDAGVDDVTDLRISGEDSKLAVVGHDQLCVHDFQAREGPGDSAADVGFWMLSLDGSPSVVPYGGTTFEQQFRQALQGEPPSWDAAVSAYRAVVDRG